MPHIDAATLAHFAGLRVIARGQPPDRPSQVERPTTHLGVSFSLIAEVLVRARSELARPERWMQGAAGMTADGFEHLDPEQLFIYPERRVLKLCADGAICWAAFWLTKSQREREQVSYAAEDLFDIAAGEDIAEYNDAPGRTHAEVMAIFDRAIHMAVTP